MKFSLFFEINNQCRIVRDEKIFFKEPTTFFVMACVVNKHNYNQSTLRSMK